jgi:mono/diheme cytochrome c family protein
MKKTVPHLHPGVAIALGITLLAFSGAAAATPKTIALPPDGVMLKESPLPGYAKAQANCVACHSAEYMRYQPATAPRPYWEAMTKRMKAVFNAPIADADMPQIVDYLVKTYGNEQPK